MLSPNDLIEIRKIAALAAVFSSEDFRKATEAHAERFNKIEEVHKEKLRRYTEQQQFEINNLRLTLKEEENKLKASEQANNDAAQKLAQDKVAFGIKCKEQEANFNKREVALHTAEEVRARQDKQTAERLADVVQREKRAEEMEQQYLANSRALQERLNKLRALTT